MKHLKSLLMCISFLIMSMLAYSQNNFSFDIRGGYSFPVEDLGSVELSDGYGFETNVGYKFLDYLGVYGGFSWNQLTDKSVEDNTIDYHESGLLLGLEFNYPIVTDQVNLFLRGGGIYNQVKLENNENEVIQDTDYGFGWQGYVGVEVMLTENLSILPGARFHSLNREYLTYEGMEKSNLRYVNLGLAFRRVF